MVEFICLTVLVAWVMEGYIGKGQLGVRDSVKSGFCISFSRGLFLMVCVSCFFFAYGLWVFGLCLGSLSGVGSVSWSAFFLIISDCIGHGTMVGYTGHIIQYGVPMCYMRIQMDNEQYQSSGLRLESCIR